MRRLFVVLVCMVIVISSFGEQILLKAVPSYGLLLSPDLSDKKNIREGGIGISVQLLFGKGTLKYGPEVGYLPIYYYKETSPSFFGFPSIETEHSVSATLVLGVLNYTLSEKDKISLNLQGGLGLTSVSVKTSIGGDTKSDQETHFSLMLGPNISIKASENIDLDISVKYYHIATDDPCSTLNIGAGICFKF